MWSRIFCEKELVSFFTIACGAGSSVGTEWIAEYRAKRPGLSVLQAEIDAFMADYDAREEQVLSSPLAPFLSLGFG